MNRKFPVHRRLYLMEGEEHAVQARVPQGFLGAELRGERLERPAARSAAADFAKGRVLHFTAAVRVQVGIVHRALGVSRHECEATMTADGTVDADLRVIRRL